MDTFFYPGAKIRMATTKAKGVYSEVEFGVNDFIMFGKENAGIPEKFDVKFQDDVSQIFCADDYEYAMKSTTVMVSRAYCWRCWLRLFLMSL